MSQFFVISAPVRSTWNPLEIKKEKRVLQARLNFWYPEIVKPKTELLTQFTTSASVPFGCIKTEEELPVCRK
jgi:hypothetical protein